MLGSRDSSFLVQVLNHCQVPLSDSSILTPLSDPDPGHLIPSRSLAPASLGLGQEEVPLQNWGLSMDPLGGWCIYGC